MRTYFKTFEEIDLPTLAGLVEGMWEEGRRQLRLEGFDDSRHEIITQADMKYEGQVSDLTVPVPAGPVTQATLTAVAENFDQEHEQSFGYRQSPIEGGASYQLVNIRVIARGRPDAPRMPERFELAAAANGSSASRRVYFGPSRGWADTPVLTRPSLQGRTETGPLVIEEYDSTTVVPPTWTASVDDASNIILERP